MNISEKNVISVIEILDHTWNDIVFLEDFDEGFAISGLLVQSLLEENDT